MSAPERFTNYARTNCVEVVRHTYDCFEVVAFDLFGRELGHRMFAYGKHRRRFAIEQAESYAERFGLYFSGTIHN